MEKIGGVQISVCEERVLSDRFARVMRLIQNKNKKAKTY